MKKFHLLLALSIVVFAFVYGVIVGVYGVFPFQQMRALENQLSSIPYVLRKSRQELHTRLAADCEGTAEGVYEADGYRWELLTESAEYAPRDGAGAVVFNGKLYLIGGWNPDDKRNFPLTTANDVWVSADDGKSWIEIKT